MDRPLLTDIMSDIGSDRRRRRKDGGRGEGRRGSETKTVQVFVTI